MGPGPPDQMKSKAMNSMSSEDTLPSAGTSTDGPDIPPGLTVLWDIGVVVRLMGNLLDDVIVDAGISARDFHVLSIFAAQGSLTPSDVATRTGIPAPTVSKLLARLAAQGLVEEQPHPDDGRSRLVDITEV
jgi:DNA-binding transcriptional ArsR family regulator